MAKLPRHVDVLAVRVRPSTGRRKLRKKKRRMPERKARRAKARKRVPDYSPLRVGKRTAFAEPHSPTKLCKPYKEERPPKECFVKVMFVGRKLAARYGKKPGAYLLSCNRAAKPDWLPQGWIPVKSIAEAHARAEAFCECYKKRGDNESCTLRARKARRRRRRR